MPEVPYPKHPDPYYKFRPSSDPCVPGAPVVDSAMRFDGKACCSSCRRTMTLDEGVWVHD